MNDVAGIQERRSEAEAKEAAGDKRRAAGGGSPRLSAILPFLAVLVPLCMLAGDGWLNWRAAWSSAAEALARDAAAVAEFGERTLGGYVVAAGRMNDRLRGLSDDAIRESEGALHTELQTLVADLSQSDVAFVIDRQGVPLLATSIYPVPRTGSLADRDYFQGLVNSPSSAIYVSQQFVGRFDNRFLFAIARPRHSTGNLLPESNKFDGVVSISVNPDSVAEGMRELMAPGITLALVKEDGHLLARTSGQTGQSPPIAPSSPFHDLAARGVVGAVYSSTTAEEGSESLIAIRRLDGFPIYAVSLRPRAAIVGGWRREMVGHLAFGLPATLALLALSLRIRADQRRLQRAHAALGVKADRDADRLVRAERFGLVGTFEYDIRTGINHRSPEYMRVQGLPAQPAIESHADWARRLHPDDRERAESGLREAISDTSGITDYGQTYRVVAPDGTMRWIAARATIERGPDGKALMMRGAHVDVTPLRTSQVALAESDARLRLAQEAVGIGTWEWHPASRAFNWSAKMIELWGFDPSDGQPVLEDIVARLHPKDRFRVRREMAVAHRSGSLRTEFRILRPKPGGAPLNFWVVVKARLLPPEGGPGAQLLGVAYDITPRKIAEQEAELLAREVEHRAKNALSVVLGLLRITAAETQAEFLETLEARIKALAGTMTLLGNHRWAGARLDELLRHELNPFTAVPQGQQSRLDLAGTEVMLPPDVAEPLSMALHELTTNAVKYGALSVPEGRLEVSWRWEDGMLVLTWREIGAPPRDGAPNTPRFGTFLIDQTICARLDGAIERHWEASGLVCEIRLPLDRA